MFSPNSVMQKAIRRDIPSGMAESDRIYILGIGNIGRIFAHSLAQLPNAPPITLLLHRQALADEFMKNGRTIEIISGGISNAATGFDFEVIEKSPDHERNKLSETPSRIGSLIVATKTTQTLSAVSSIGHRLNASSSVLFTQNGMGTIDEVNEKVFPNPKDRPSYLAAIISHGIYTTGAFSSVHAGFGTVKVGCIEDAKHQDPVNGSVAAAGISSRMLLDLIVSASVLSATKYPPAELIKIQLEKLVMNAILNPLTSIFRVRNGMLFGKRAVVDLMHVLVREASQILIAFLGDESAETAIRFGESNLERLVLDVAVATAGNRSSMLQDVESGRQTEVDYINGWFVKKGALFGIRCNNHARLVEMVKERRVIEMDEIEKYFPDVAEERQRVTSEI